jgi:flagellar motility protein MotE (MotC chaperone)
MTMRVLVVLVTLGAVAKTLGLGTTLLGAGAETAHAAAPAAEPADPVEGSCAFDGRGFRDLLQAVRTKSDELDRRETELRAREAGLTAMRRAVSGEVARLEGVAKTLGITETQGAGVSIAKIYESMSPAEAAPILERLDDRTLRAVLARMRDRQVAAILAAMDRDRAVAVTKAFAGPPSPAATH